MSGRILSCLFSHHENLIMHRDFHRNEKKADVDENGMHFLWIESSRQEKFSLLGEVSVKIEKRKC